MPKLRLLPTPKSLTKMDGCFQLSPHVRIVLDVISPANSLAIALLLQSEILNVTGIKANITKVFLTATNPGDINLKLGSGKSESYQLMITPEAITIAGADRAGLLYGVQTLRQLIRFSGNSLPCLKIDDYPSFPYRGFLHDVTRGKVPTLETLKELVDRLAFYKLNQLHLYIEHSFAFQKHTEIWLGQDPLTAEGILQLDAYCQQNQVELVPCMATFGHLYQALRTESFKQLNELPEDRTPYSWIDRQHHHTLDVSNPQSLIFVKQMIDEFLPLFTSNKFNIGCDETFDLGEGKNKALAEKVGKGRLYVDFLKQIIAHVRQYGKQVLFWGDIILMHPEFLPEIPPEVVALNWDYSANVTEEHTRTFAEHQIGQYVCPGTKSWDRLICDLGGSFLNISKLGRYGGKYRALGMLNTDWGDHGHIHPLAASIPGLIFGAVFAWDPAETATLEDLNQTIARLEFGDASGGLLDVLHAIAQKAPVTWRDIDIWYEKLLGHTWGHEDLREHARSWTAESLRTGYEVSLKGVDVMAGLYRHVPTQSQLYLKEFQVAAAGTALFQALGIFIQSTETGAEPETVILTPFQLAEALERWFFDYAIIWRIRNQESELYRIRDFIAGICRVLRRGEYLSSQGKDTCDKLFQY